MKSILKISLIVFMFFFKTAHAQETKAIWVVRHALTSKSISTIIDNAKKLKSNKIFLQLRALGKVFYPTKLDIPVYEIDAKAFAELINKAKDNNIEVHAWINFSYVSSQNKHPLPGNHIISKTPNSIIYSPVNGVKSEGYFLHPNDEKNLSEVINIVRELIEKYQISGIHLDYFRYPKDLSQTSKSGRTEYIVRHGLDPIIPINDPNGFIKQRGIGSYSYFKKSYAEFLRDELTEALIAIKDTINKTDKNIQLSVAVKPNPVKAKHQFYQDWPLWINEGYCDFVVIMNYNPDDTIFYDNMRIIKSIVPENKVMVGIATYNSKKEQVLTRLKGVTGSEFAGYSLFSYNFIMENSDLYRYLMESI